MLLEFISVPYYLNRWNLRCFIQILYSWNCKNIQPSKFGFSFFKSSSQTDVLIIIKTLLLFQDRWINLVFLGGNRSAFAISRSCWCCFRRARDIPTQMIVYTIHRPGQPRKQWQLLRICERGRTVAVGFVKNWEKKMKKSEFVLILLWNLCSLSCQSKLFESDMRLNQLTRGYEDITIVIDKQLRPEQCGKILKDLKVSKKNRKELQKHIFCLESSFLN